MNIVSDTSPISNLAAIQHLQLLQQLYGRIIIPSAVFRELINAGNEEPAAIAVRTLDWIEVKVVSDQSLLLTLQANLDMGEAEAIALAVEIGAKRLIIDERRGRNEAIELGLQVTGVLGILLAAKQRKLIPFVKPLLDELRANSFS
jgi:predicted nucleic acid-binding protein